MVDIEFHIGAVDATKWANGVFVYSMGDDAFSVTFKKNEALEKQAEHKFAAKSISKDGDVIVFLPDAFARDYFENRNATLYQIGGGVEEAILVLCEPKAKVEEKKP
jgi:Tfp pilus assembly protein FimT